MRIPLLLLALLAGPVPVAAQTADSSAVLATLDRFLAALKAKDTTAMREVLHPKARFTLLRPAPGGGVQVAILDAESFPRLTSAPGQPGLDEPIRNPVVLIDADLASVWAEYQVRSNGAVSHCGFDAFHLVRQPTGWKILNVSDTFRRAGCGSVW